MGNGQTWSKKNGITEQKQSMCVTEMIQKPRALGRNTCDMTYKNIENR